MNSELFVSLSIYPSTYVSVILGLVVGIVIAFAFLYFIHYAGNNRDLRNVRFLHRLLKKKKISVEEVVNKMEKLE